MQPGVLLLVNGQIIRVKAFSNTYSSKTVRNRVGIQKDDHDILATSTQPVNFHELAQHRQQQGSVKALYLDYGISALHCTRNGHFGQRCKLGPMVAFVEN
jgi:uncharacterized protein YigE (DUF2233 family)